MGDLCIIGKILGPYGLKGKVCVKPITDFVERFKKLKRVYIGDNPIEVEEHYVVSSFLRDDDVILQFRNVNDRTAAESFSGKFIYIPEEELVPLPEDSYYVHDLIGLKVCDVNGNKIGVITDVWLLPAKISGAICLQASQSIQVESTKNSPFTFTERDLFKLAMT